MKRLMAFVLCVALLSCAAISVSASVYELADYGQKTAVLTAPMTPLIDGYIEEEEYEVAIKAVLDEDGENDEFYVHTNTDVSITDAEYVTFYMAADGDNIYFAVEQKDPLRVGHFDALYLQISAGERIDSYIQIYFPYNAPIEVLSEKDRARWSEYSDNFAASYSNDITLYEIAIPRKIIGDVFGVESYDKLLVALTHRVHYHPDEGSVHVTWGFRNDELSESYVAQPFPVFGYPNVLELYSIDEDADGEELPEVPTVVMPETEKSEETESYSKTPESEPEKSETENKEETDTDDGCGVSLASGAITFTLIVVIGTDLLLKRETNKVTNKFH